MKFYDADSMKIIVDNLQQYPGSPVYSIEFFGKKSGYTFVPSIHSENDLINLYTDNQSGKLWLQIPASIKREGVQADIYTISGKLIFHNATLYNEFVDIRELPKGVYVLKINSNAVVHNYKFLKL